jgi:hypothetical protein
MAMAHITPPFQEPDVEESSTDEVGPMICDTVDGCEILHHQPDGCNMLNPYK